MKYFNTVKNWFSKHYVAIIIGGFVFLYAWASIKAQEIKTGQNEAEYACQSFCFPQQHESIRRGNAESCWCYKGIDQLERRKDESRTSE